MMSDQNEMEKIVTPMMEHVCDHLCRFPWEIADQEEMSRICHECKMNQYEQEIKDTYNRINDFDKSQCAYLLQELAKEREKQRWISVTERLPRMEEYKVVTAGGRQYFRRLEIAVQADTIEYYIGYFDRHKWFDKRHRGFKGNVIAWKQMPELCQGDQNTYNAARQLQAAAEVVRAEFLKKGDWYNALVNSIYGYLRDTDGSEPWGQMARDLAGRIAGIEPAEQMSLEN